MIRRIRLASGLVMLGYVAMHLLNHALGLVSGEAVEPEAPRPSEGPRRSLGIPGGLQVGRDLRGILVLGGEGSGQRLMIVSAEPGTFEEAAF